MTGDGYDTVERAAFGRPPARELLPGWLVTADGVLTVPCPSSLEDDARAHLTGHGTVATPRLAATVMLVRPGWPDLLGGGAETFMLHRSMSMAFAPGAMVFPGGAVDRRDGEPIPWAGPHPREWAELLGCDRLDAQAIVVAAVRELFEESGVLLAGVDGDHVVQGLDTPMWQQEIRRLASHRASLAEVLIRHGLVLRSDLLGLRDHWVTPEFEPRRYDTYFFAARTPEGQTATALTTEAISVRWTSARAVLDAAGRGEVQLFPPTAHNIARLAESDSVEQFTTTGRAVGRLMLVPRERPEGDIVLSCRLGN
ncbi:NUDIX hydrolase [Raineyella fluvialis]|uniref:NUDIX hydrolase n=1 Tax=Raineyella fluvialis TaxID=2662261 RepID=A0A5Q2FBK7_9ACTN|nr:NUDIX hydrolase [Raineyella fluvialis]QGF22423.1 NUDIX hydrolase [Raineyella fluvialis]